MPQGIEIILWPLLGTRYKSVSRRSLYLKVT